MLTLRGTTGWVKQDTGEHRDTLPPCPTIDQTAAYYGVHRRTVRRWISDGRLRARRLGPGTIRLDRREVLNLGLGMDGRP